MVDRSFFKRALIIADKGYESYNLMTHIQEKGWKYLIHIRDIHSSGIVKGLELPHDDEFDLYFHFRFTKWQTAEAKQLLSDKPSYKRLPSTAPFDYLPSSSRKRDPLSLYYLPFRVVRFKLSGSSYETVITNLDPVDFPPDELKRLYGTRWGIETSPRKLKYIFIINPIIFQYLFKKSILDNISLVCDNSRYIASFPKNHISAHKYNPLF